MPLAPAVTIHSIRRIYDQGPHSAFTDLCCFQGHIYLAFRRCPDGHGVFPTSCIVVMRSADGQDWEVVHEFSVRDRDVRDPHFLVFGGALFVYTGTWLSDPARPDYRDMNDHLGYGAWTSDGESWEGPRSLDGTYGHYVWRAAAYGNKAYLCGRRKRDFAHWSAGEGRRELTQSVLLESEDGLIWRTAGLFAETCGDETAFLFENSGALLAIVRGHGNDPAQLCRSTPPYREWVRSRLGRNIGGPLLVKWGDHYLVGGRKTIEANCPVTTLYWLLEDRLEEICELPSSGDNSYPGFVQTGETTALLSYYSSHQKRPSGESMTAIYLAELQLQNSSHGLDG